MNYLWIYKNCSEYTQGLTDSNSV